MNLALTLLSVVAFSTAAPENYTSHFQIFQASTTELTPSSTDIHVDGTDFTSGLTHSKGGAPFVTKGNTVDTNDTTDETDGATEATITGGATVSSTEGATNVTSGSIYSTKGETSTTKSVTSSANDATTTTDGATFFRDGASSTTRGATHASDGASNVTAGSPNAADKKTDASIGVTARSDVTSKTVKSTTEVVSGTSSEEVDDESSSDAPISTGDGVRKTMGSPDRDDTPKVQGNATKTKSGEVEEPGFGFTFKLPTIFTTFLEQIPAIGSAGSNTKSSEIFPNLHGNGDSDAISTSQNSNGGLNNHSIPPLTPFNSTTTKTSTTTISPSASGGKNSFISSSSFDPSSSSLNSSGHNSLSTSDFITQPTPLRPEHLSRIKKSLTESEMRRNQEIIASSRLHRSPDYFVTPFTAVGRDNSNVYDFDYYPQAFPAVRTPEVYEQENPHNLNNGGYTGQFQYIIRTSDLPGVLASFPASLSSSAVHPSLPDTRLPGTGFSTGSQSGVGHVALASQPSSHVSLLPNFQSSSSFNFGSNPQHSFGVANSLGGSSLEGHQPSNADSASGTERPVKSEFSNTTEASIASHGTNKIFSTRISDPSNNVTRSSPTTQSPSFDSSDATTASTDGAERVSASTESIDQETTDQEPATHKPSRNF